MSSRDLLIGIGIGAVVTFVADLRAIANRTSHRVAIARNRWTDEPVEDATLLRRVRTKLNRCSSHPRAINVAVHDGFVTLRGPVLAAEVDAVIRAVGSVAGVHTVSHEMQAHESAEGIPALQTIEPGSYFTAPRVSTRTLVAAAGLAATGLAVAAYSRRNARMA